MKQSNNILVYFGWSYKHTADVRLRSVIDMTIEFKKIKPENNFLFVFQTNQKFKRYKEVCENAGIKAIHFSDYDSDKKLKKWSKLYSDWNDILNEYSIDTLFLNCLQITKDVYLDHEDNLKKFYQKTIENDLFTHNFVSGYRSKYFLACMYNTILNRPDIKIVHQIVDPNEVNVNNLKSDAISLFNYELNFRNVEYFPFGEWAFVYGFTKNKQINDKNNDFIFGFASHTRNEGNFREGYAKSLDVVKEKFEKLGIPYEIYFKGFDGKGNKVEDYLMSDKYHERVAASKFTLVIPAHNNNVFSQNRFFESITLGCVPIIEAKVNTDGNYFHQYPDIKKYYEENNLIIDFENLPDRMTELVEKYRYHYDNISNLYSLKAPKELNFFVPYFSKLIEKISS